MARQIYTNVKSESMANKAIRDQLAKIADKPHDPRWAKLIDWYGEAKLIRLGADI